MVNAICFFPISRQLRPRNKNRSRKMAHELQDEVDDRATWPGPEPPLKAPDEHGSAADRDQPVALGLDVLDDPGEGSERLATVSPAVVQEDDRPRGEAGEGAPYDHVGTGTGPVTRVGAPEHRGEPSLGQAAHEAGVLVSLWRPDAGDRPTG